MPSSSASSTCRIDWYPSRGLAAVLIVLGLLAAAALWNSALPRTVAAMGGLLCAGTGMKLARSALRQPPVRVVWAGGREPALICRGERQFALSHVSLHLRGPMAVLSGRDEDGRRASWVWYPDTLTASDRRSLRLAAAMPDAAPSTLPLFLT